MAIGIQTSIWENRLKTILLLFLFPFLFFGLFYAGILFFNYSDGIALENIFSATNNLFMSFIIIIFPILFLWILISFLFHRQIVFSFSGAKPLTRKECPEIYNLVENLCISRGLQIPNIGIIHDESMNAFATGINEKNAWIVFSKGLLTKLEKEEIEAVAAHELTHIINRDCLLMVVIVVVIGAFATIGEIIYRAGISSNRNSKNNNKNGTLFFLVGLLLMLLGYVIYPLLQLAISRKREFLADAGSVTLTGNSKSLISALQKISTDSRIEAISQHAVANMCIENPREPKQNFFEQLLSTHPSVADRISALKKY